MRIKMSSAWPLGVFALGACNGILGIREMDYDPSTAGPDGGPDSTERGSTDAASPGLISAGEAHTCAALASRDGGVLCWGNNYWQQIGPQRVTFEPRPVPVQYLPHPAATSLAAGAAYTCLAYATDGVWCFGLAISYQLAGTCGADGCPPLPASGSADSGAFAAVTVVAGAKTTCAIAPDRSVWCWGADESGETTDPDASGDFTPYRTPLADVSRLAAGSEHVCAVSGSATSPIECWGVNNTGQLGTTDFTMSTKPVTPVWPWTAPPVFVAGGHSHTCVLDSASRLVCWGDDSYGQTGNPAPGGAPTLAPHYVDGVDTAAAVFAGGAVTCIVRSDTSASCMGANTRGQLGRGTVDAPSDAGHPEMRPVVDVDGGGVLLGVSSMAIGGSGLGNNEHVCALLTSGAVVCWGANDDGQLGDGTADGGPQSRATPVLAVPGQ
jgi:alpha-tubulin suppressor-like RCC1 family protein